MLRITTWRPRLPPRAPLPLCSGLVFRRETMRTVRMFTILMVALVAAKAQQPTVTATPAPASDQGPIPIFKGGTSLVVVDVTVKNKAGKPIEGLKISDFVVLEDG